MSTAAEIVTQAYREGNFIAVGEAPTAAEMAEGIPRLRSLLDSLFGLEIGEAYQDWYVPSDFSTNTPLRTPLAPATDVSVSGVLWQYPPPNRRLLVNTTEARTVYFPANPADGARMQLLNIGSAAVNVTVNGNGHLVENALTVVDTAANLHGRKWFYRADLGDWIRLVSLTADASVVPLPSEFDDLLVCGLAIRLSTRFQVAVDAATSGRFADMLRRLKKRYKQTEGIPLSNYNDLQATGAHSTTMGL